MKNFMKVYWGALVVLALIGIQFVLGFIHGYLSVVG